MSDTPTPRTYAAQLHVADAYADYQHQDTGRPYLEHVVTTEFASELERELQEAQARIRLLVAERDSARQQADQNWKLREEFTALLGTDDVKEGVHELKRLKGTP